jgi:RNA polymerase sigma factor (sigma-70 family)
MDSWQTRITLVEKLRDRKDEAAWEEFARHYRSFIQMVAQRMGQSHHDAEETAQEVLLRLWEKLPAFSYDPERGSFRGFITVITGNKVRDAVRRTRPSCELRTENEGSVSPEIVRIAEEEWKKHIAQLAWDAIKDSFEERTRQVFLALSSGGEPDQVAHELGLTTNAVYVYKKRVVDRLCAEIRRLDAELW